MRRQTVLLAILALATAPGLPASQPGPDTWTVWYSVDTRARGARADADLQAGGSLAMSGRTLPSGKLLLSLIEVREHPWKLYWIDPLGPVGEEVKMASVVTLAEATWDALATARRQNASAARRRHADWLARAERPRPLDGSFAFIVVGPARGRFLVELGTGGIVKRVTNRMTDRWLTGPFDRFIGTWDQASPTTPAEVGYWFWNQGQTEPFDYEPHTYHAFAAALELLRLPLPGPPDLAADATIWKRVQDRAARVVEILAPRTNPRRLRAGPDRAYAVESAWTRLADGTLQLDCALARAGPGLLAERRTVFSSEGRPRSDRIRVRLASKRTGTLQVEAGYYSNDLTEG